MSYVVFSVFIIGFGVGALCMSLKGYRKRQDAPTCITGEEIAVQCWCDPRTASIPIDIKLATVYAEKISKNIEALRWCGGSEDFAHGGKSEVGWKIIVSPLIGEDPTPVDVAKLSQEQYRVLRQDHPELLGF